MKLDQAPEPAAQGPTSLFRLAGILAMKRFGDEAVEAVASGSWQRSWQRSKQNAYAAPVNERYDACRTGAGTALEASNFTNAAVTSRSSSSVNSNR